MTDEKKPNWRERGRRGKKSVATRHVPKDKLLCGRNHPKEPSIEYTVFRALLSAHRDYKHLRSVRGMSSGKRTKIRLGEVTFDSVRQS